MIVGFIGLGAMGLPMAKRVLSAGYKMYTTFHRRREPAQELGSMGAEFLQTPGEVAQAADIVITIVPADAELKNTIFGKTGILSGFSNGKVLIEMTTGTALAMRDRTPSAPTWAGTARWSTESPRDQTCASG